MNQDARIWVAGGDTLIGIALLNRHLYGSPLRSALTVGFSYLAGAAVPVLGYFFVPPHEGLTISVVATVATLFVVGAAKTIITARSWWRSGLESMATGIAAAAVTYGAGRFFASR